jgi:hypothetical protein
MDADEAESALSDGASGGAFTHDGNGSVVLAVFVPESWMGF